MVGFENLRLFEVVDERETTYVIEINYDGMRWV
ncbi:hypothetical protein Xvie_02251 [Xenorhabdus vietnamensis]|uniref:Uncharacterized protein n=1 Tax=Xenorhabdus vietnamensis TaxID=351656 RepID=A0A1Y2SB41_9GAMM|nr:hypothetical protein Xvie_02251 [Xenorhabdus vietnamensis]